MTGRTALRLDLSGLEEHCTQPPQPVSPRARRVLVLLVVIAVLAAAVGLLRALLEGDVGHLLVSLVPGALVQLASWIPSLPALQPQTRLSAEELDVRSDLVRRERVPWGRVVGVHPAGRWEDSAHVDLDGGRRLPLPHVPPEDVLRLGEALARARARQRPDEEDAGG